MAPQKQPCCLTRNSWKGLKWCQRRQIHCKKVTEITRSSVQCNVNVFTWMSGSTEFIEEGNMLYSLYFNHCFKYELIVFVLVFTVGRGCYSPVCRCRPAAVVKKTTCCCHDAVLASNNPSAIHPPKKLLHSEWAEDLVSFYVFTLSGATSMIQGTRIYSAGSIIPVKNTGYKLINSHFPALTNIVLTKIHKVCWRVTNFIWLTFDLWFMFSIWWHFVKVLAFVHIFVRAFKSLTKLWFIWRIAPVCLPHVLAYTWVTEVNKAFPEP